MPFFRQGAGAPFLRTTRWVVPCATAARAFVLRIENDGRVSLVVHQARRQPPGNTLRTGNLTIEIVYLCWFTYEKWCFSIAMWLCQLCTTCGRIWILLIQCDSLHEINITLWFMLDFFTISGIQYTFHLENQPFTNSPLDVPAMSPPPLSSKMACWEAGNSTSIFHGFAFSIHQRLIPHHH